MSKTYIKKEVVTITRTEEISLGDGKELDQQGYMAQIVSGITGWLFNQYKRIYKSKDEDDG